MNIDEIVKNLTPEVYEKLLISVETGRWEDGRVLTLEQKQQSMQLVMLYQSRFNDTAQHMSIAKGGEIQMKSKAQLQQEFKIKDQDRIDIKEE